MPSRPVPPAEKPTLESLATGLEKAYREIWKLRDEKMEMAFEIQVLGAEEDFSPSASRF